MNEPYILMINGEDKHLIEAETLTKAEKIIINEYMSKQPDKSTAYIYIYDKLVSYIVKDKTKDHWTHPGYMFSI